MRYFHNGSLYELDGDDYRGIFRLDGADPAILPPYTELVRFDAGPRLTGDALRGAALQRLRHHLDRVHPGNPFERFATRLADDLPAPARRATKRAITPTRSPRCGWPAPVDTIKDHATGTRRVHAGRDQRGGRAQITSTQARVADIKAKLAKCNSFEDVVNMIIQQIFDMVGLESDFEVDDIRQLWVEVGGSIDEGIVWATALASGQPTEPPAGAAAAGGAGGAGGRRSRRPARAARVRLPAVPVARLARVTRPRAVPVAQASRAETRPRAIRACRPARPRRRPARRRRRGLRAARPRATIWSGPVRRLPRAGGAASAPPAIDPGAFGAGAAAGAGRRRAGAAAAGGAGAAAAGAAGAAAARRAVSVPRLLKPRGLPRPAAVSAPLRLEPPGLPVRPRAASAGAAAGAAGAAASAAGGVGEGCGRSSRRRDGRPRGGGPQGDRGHGRRARIGGGGGAESGSIADMVRKAAEEAHLPPNPLPAVAAGVA